MGVHQAPGTPSAARAAMIARPSALGRHLSLSPPVVGLLPQPELSHSLAAVVQQQEPSANGERRGITARNTAR